MDPITPTPPFSFDGCGINDAEGRRILTRQRQHHIDGGSYVASDESMRTLGPKFAAGPALQEVLREFVSDVEAVGPEALEGEAKDETFACTVNPDGSVTLAAGATVIPATDPADPNP